MAERDSHKNQQKKMKKAANAIGTEQDHGKDIAEGRAFERKNKK